MRIEVSHAPQAPDGVPAGRVVSLRTADHVDLAAREHEADAPRGLVVVLGAMATPARFYARFAEHLASRGLSTLRFDYRGIGGSRDGGLESERAGVLDWTVRDVESALAWARARHPSLPLAVVGHSLGGQAVGIAPSAHQVDAVVLVASQSGWVGHWPGLSRLRMELMWRAVVPGLTHAVGYLPGWSGIGEDVPANVAREWARWCTTPGYVTGALPDGELFYRDVRAPVLAWSFTDDDYAPGGAIEELLGWLTAAEVERRHVDPAELGARRVGHFGFFRPSATALWDRTADWLLAALERPRGRAER